MKTYTIHSYTTGAALATVEMTSEQWAAYEADAQQPEGCIEVRDLAAIIDLSGLDVWGGTVVYLD